MRDALAVPGVVKGRAAAQAGCLNDSAGAPGGSKMELVPKAHQQVAAPPGHQGGLSHYARLSSASGKKFAHITQYAPALTVFTRSSFCPLALP